MNARTLQLLVAGVLITIAVAWLPLRLEGVTADSPSVSWRCVGPSPQSAWFKNVRPNPGCPSLQRPLIREANRRAETSVAPSNLTGAVAGSTVTLNWSPPASSVVSYVVEAGSAPGLSNLASFDTGTPATSLAVTQVPDGTFFVRVRARDAAGSVSAPSNEVVVTVATACGGLPSAPTGLTVSVVDAAVTLRWTQPASPCRPSGYLVQAGSSTGLSNLANVSTGSTDTTLSVTDVADGTYYVRVIAVNPNGASAPSNEAIVVVRPTCTNSSGDPNTSRPPRCLGFAGFQWIVKSSPNFGPGPNAWSDGSDDVWVDDRGLHLTIARHGDRWYASEVMLNRSLGFGTYTFRTATRLDQLDPNAVLGLFTYNYADTAFNNREIDIEFSPLLGRTRGANAHFTVQPYTNPLNIHDFIFGDSRAASTHTFEWTRDHVTFSSGTESWTYREGGVPQPGGENVRLNLWLFNGVSSPAGQARVEVVVSGFQFTP